MILLPMMLEGMEDFPKLRHRSAQLCVHHLQPSPATGDCCAQLETWHCCDWHLYSCDLGWLVAAILGPCVVAASFRRLVPTRTDSTPSSLHEMHALSATLDVAILAVSIPGRNPAAAMLGPYLAGAILVPLPRLLYLLYCANETRPFLSEPLAQATNNGSKKSYKIDKCQSGSNS